MRRISVHVSRALITVVLTALLAGCSEGGSSAIAPNVASAQGGTIPAAAPMPSGPRLPGIPRSIGDGAHPISSFYSCPATGSVKYVADFYNRAVNVYAGKFAGQAPCGQIASGIFVSPYGLYVRPATHDLYVADIYGSSILVFHRGQTTPYNTYTDPSGQYPQDVVVAKDGTIIASNRDAHNPEEGGSLSTWVGGPNGGTFVGNFRMANGDFGGFLTVRKNGTVYFDVSTGRTSIWSVSCPAGACGVQTQVAGITLNAAGGLAVDDDGDLLASDASPGLAETFELPNPVPKTFPIYGHPQGMAINKLDHHWFVADQNDIATEYSYPGGVLLGDVVVNPPDAWVYGIAVDP